MVKAILTKPLDGDPEGAEREFDQQDFDRLKEMGAVREASAADNAVMTDAKLAPPVSNKMAPPVANKAAGDIVRSTKG